LLLASQSPRRRELLALLGLPFDTTVADVAEDPLADESPDAAALRLSQAKARAARSRGERGRGACPEQRRGACPEQGRGTRPDTLIIACDTVVALDGELLGKPRDATEALSVLRRLRGRSHTVFSAVTLLEPVAGRTSSDVAATRLAMRTYTDAEMAAYVASGDPLDKAGAYGIQHPGFHPVAELQGCYANVMGLPLCHLTRALRAWDIEPSRDVPAACQAHTGHRCPVYATILAGRPDRQAAHDR
jgi:septum formation protein